MEDIDWNGYWNQAVQYWDQGVQYWDRAMHVFDQPTHWMMNDGASAMAFLLFMLLCALAVFLTARGRRKQISQSRAGYDVECFVREMSAAGYEAEMARFVYHYIQDVYRIDYPILPGDDLYTLGATDDAVHRTMPALIQATGRETRMGHVTKPLSTVEDLVAYIESLPHTADYVWELQHA
jgi:hypothetical protein